MKFYKMKILNIIVIKIKFKIICKLIALKILYKVFVVYHLYKKHLYKI